MSNLNNRKRNLGQRMRYTLFTLQFAAHRAVAKAVKRGELSALTINGKSTGIACVDCHRPARDYDHRDYFEQLKVEPTCRSCNINRGLPFETLRKLGMTERRISQLSIPKAIELAMKQIDREESK
jgi:hypothetical protein